MEKNPSKLYAEHIFLLCLMITSVPLLCKSHNTKKEEKKIKEMVASEELFEESSTQNTKYC